MITFNINIIIIHLSQIKLIRNLNENFGKKIVLKMSIRCWMADFAERPWSITDYASWSHRISSRVSSRGRASDESCLSYEICNRVGTGFNENPWHNGVNASEEASVYPERGNALSKRFIKLCKNNPRIDRKVSSRRVPRPNFHVSKNYSLSKTCTHFGISLFFLYT